MTTNDDKNSNPWGGGGDNNRGNKPEDIDEILRKGQEKIVELITHNNKKKKSGKGGGRGGSGGNRGNIPDLPAKKLLMLLLIIVLGLWFSTGFYTVQPDEQGVIMRFGKYHRTASSGLNYKLPTPFEKVTILSVTRVNKEEIGFRSASSDSSRRVERSRNKNKSKKSIPQESQMLTEDENIIDIDFDVQWVIKDAKQYLFNVRDLSNENTVKNTAESAMREVIGQVGISEALAEERSDIEFKAKTLLQNTLDSYGMGVEIMRVQMLRVEPPPEVLAAYRDVQSSKADREKVINQASAYRNEIVPQARGDAEKLLQEAESYQKQRIALAVGEAGRFDAIYRQYIKAKDITRKRMYLETLEEIFTGMNKIILDKNTSTSGVLPYLPLNQLSGDVGQRRNNAKPLNYNQNN